MKFVTSGKSYWSTVETQDFASYIIGRYETAKTISKTIDFRIRSKTDVNWSKSKTMRKSVSFEQFIYNGEFDPGSG
jgi:hypothetical protein